MRQHPQPRPHDPPPVCQRASLGATAGIRSTMERSRAGYSVRWMEISAAQMLCRSESLHPVRRDPRASPQACRKSWPAPVLHRIKCAFQWQAQLPVRADSPRPSAKAAHAMRDIFHHQGAGAGAIKGEDQRIAKIIQLAAKLQRGLDRHANAIDGRPPKVRVIAPLELMRTVSGSRPSGPSMVQAKL